MNLSSFLDDYVLPKGANLLISPFTTHRLAHIFPDPLKFDPDRFSAENAQNVHPYGFLPFSLGARNCLGTIVNAIDFLVMIFPIFRI